MPASRVSEYGRKWDARTPRDTIARIVRRQHVGTPIADIEQMIKDRIANFRLKAEFPENIEAQSLEYARIVHENGRALYRRAMGG